MKVTSCWPIIFVSLLVTGFACGETPTTGVAGASRGPQAVFTGADLGELRWTQGLMEQRFGVCRDTMVPAMGRLMEGTEHGQFLQNFRVAAGLAQGEHRGPKWNDGDFYKWLEAAAAIYAVTRDPQLDRQMDEAIDVIAQAQRADGYLHTPLLIALRSGRDARPFTNPLDFETYNMGHLMTAACVHFRATGKLKLLAVARKAADFLDAAFAEPTADLAKFNICPSHYMGLVELYRTTREPRYLELARRMISCRDKVADGTDDNQDRIPFRQQTTAVGHAVRATYLYAGVTDLYAETGDRSLLGPLEAIWQDLVSHKLYITGGCGALYDGASPDGVKEQKTIGRVHQAFGRTYQLPNATAHNESCAAIGNLLWNWRMLEVTGDAKYADVIEQTLYNSVLTAASLNGQRFFYTNPLRVTEPAPVALRWSRTRQPWISVFCCPPNVARTIAESAGYAYGKSAGRIWVNLYGASALQTRLPDETPVSLVQETRYPWDGKIRLTVKGSAAAKGPTHAADRPMEFSLMLRIPAWATEATVRVNGTATLDRPTPGKYLEVRGPWAAGDVVDIDFPMPARLIEANPAVEETRNQIAILRGPIVYCLESIDLPPGVRVADVRIPRAATPSSEWEAETLGGIEVVRLKAMASAEAQWNGRLYRDVTPTAAHEIDVKLVPYFAWANRGASEMSVWLPTSH